MAVIKLYAGLRKAAGIQSTTTDAQTLSSALESLFVQFPSLKPLVMEGNSIRKYIIVTINGVNVNPAQGLNIPINPNDQVAIFQPIAGG